MMTEQQKTAINNHCRLAGPELDAVVAERVMHWRVHPRNTAHYMFKNDDEFDYNMKALVWEWKPSLKMAHAWKVVEAVQDRHEGWRFCLLGGDRTMGYALDREGNPKRGKDHSLIVVESSRVPFGWHAEFFGEIDPRQARGDRHGEAYAETAPMAICLAALNAISGEKKKAGDPGDP